MKQFFTSTDTLVQTLRAFAKANDCQALALATEMFPELTAIFESGNRNAAAFAIEHVHADDNVLWAHLENVLAHRLMGVETRDFALFGDQDVLDEAHFSRLCDAFEHIDKSLHLAHVLRAALVFSDVSKGGTPERRAEWQKSMGLDLRVHNEASAILLEKTSLLNRYPEFRHSDVLQQLIVLMVRSHGLIGQYVRGEITGDALVPVVESIRSIAPRLHERMQLDSISAAIEAIVQLYWMRNVLDTAGVRDKLMDSALFEKFEAVAAHIREAALDHSPFPVLPVTSDIPRIKQLLENRMMPLRGGAIAAGESPDELRQAIDSMDDDRIVAFYDAMRLCQLWYFEAAARAASGEREVAETLWRHIAGIGIDFFSNMHLRELPYFQALSWRQLGDELAAERVMTAARREWERFASREDDGYFSVTPFFISYVDDPRAARRAAADWLLSLVADFAGESGRSRRLAEAAYGACSDNLLSLSFVRQGFPA